MSRRAVSAFMWATVVLLFGGGSFAIIYPGSLSRDVPYAPPSQFKQTTSDNMLKRQQYMDALKAAATSPDPVYSPKKTKE
ncbi:hypothetical protein CHUAL_004310 [Chamberlinius hualienensis]